MIALVRSLLLACVVASEATFASPVKARSPYAVKDSHHVPTRWHRLDRAPADHVVNLQISLKQSQFGELERHLYEGKYIHFFGLLQGNEIALR